MITAEAGDHEGGAITKSDSSSQSAPSLSSMQSSSTICDNYITLKPDQTSTLPYPIGSLVWYKLDGQMASGHVKSISIVVKQRGLRYEIERCSDTDIISDDELICLGAGCPVRVKMDSQELNGQIHCGNNDGEVTCTVMVFHDDDRRRFKIEKDVSQECIKYNDVSASIVNDCSQGGKLTDSSHSGNHTSIPKVRDESSNAHQISSASAEAKPKSKPTNKRSRSLVNDGNERKRSMLKDVSNSARGNRRKAVDMVIRDIMDTTKCPKAEADCSGHTETGRSMLRIDIPPSMVQTRGSQIKLCGEFCVAILFIVAVSSLYFVC